MSDHNSTRINIEKVMFFKGHELNCVHEPLENLVKTQILIGGMKWGPQILHFQYLVCICNSFFFCICNSITHHQVFLLLVKDKSFFENIVHF